MKLKSRKRGWHLTLTTGIVGNATKQGKLSLVITAHVYFTRNVHILVQSPMENGNAHLARYQSLFILQPTISAKSVRTLSLFYGCIEAFFSKSSSPSSPPLLSTVLFVIRRLWAWLFTSQLSPHYNWLTHMHAWLIIIYLTLPHNYSQSCIISYINVPIKPFIEKYF